MPIIFSPVRGSKTECIETNVDFFTLNHSYAGALPAYNKKTKHEGFITLHHAQRLNLLSDVVVRDRVVTKQERSSTINFFRNVLPSMDSLQEDLKETSTYKRTHYLELK